MTLAPQSPDEVFAAVGTKLGPDGWMPIDQHRIDKFADATGDHEWLHVDPLRAENGPFGKTIAHGFLTLSLLNMVLPRLFMPTNVEWGVNYGVNRVRFPAPVPSTSRIRASGELIDAREAGLRTVITTILMTVEIEGVKKPACIAEMLQLYVFAP